MFENILEESWAYQDIKKEITEKGIKQGLEQGRKQGLGQGLEQLRKQGLGQALESYRQTIVQIVEARFPAITNWVQQQLLALTDLATLQKVSVLVSLAKDSDEARLAVLNAIESKKSIQH